MRDAHEFFFRPKFEMDETFSVIMKKEFIAIMNSHEKSGEKTSALEMKSSLQLSSFGYS